MLAYIQSNLFSYYPASVGLWASNNPLLIKRFLIGPQWTASLLISPKTKIVFYIVNAPHFISFFLFFFIWLCQYFLTPFNKVLQCHSEYSCNNTLHDRALSCSFDRCCDEAAILLATERATKPSPNFLRKWGQAFIFKIDFVYNLATQQAPKTKRNI